MMVNVDSFREQFAKYVFSGILDRHPKLQIGWFEGGIAWVPTALQDAEHMLASYQHMFNHQLEHDVRHYWDNHMSASFMVDPLGLRLIDQIGVDKVMWSSDYPHNESTFGYSEKSLATVVEAVGPGGRGEDRQHQRQEVPGDFVTDVSFADAASGSALLDIPDLPDRARMYRECGARLRASMKEKGVDALVLLGNGNVVYATGASWPLLDAGLSHVERPVAVVLADDEHPHLYMPFREGSAFDTEVPADHVHGPLYLEFDEGVEHFAKVLAGLVPPAATIAVDELTGAMRRAAGRAVPRGPAVGRGAGDRAGQAGQDRRPDRQRSQGLSHHRTGRRRRAEVARSGRAADRPLGRVRAPRVRTRRHDEHDRGHLAGDAHDAGTAARSGPPRATWRFRCCPRRRNSPRATCCGPTSASPTRGTARTSGRTWVVGEEPTSRQHAQFAKWREILDAVLAVTKAGATSGDLARAAIAANGGTKPWLPHFYLGHGIGTNAAEMPMIGTDLGQEFDDNFVFPAGMLLVLEPVVWEDGTGGYRSEEIVIITEDGYQSITDYPYAPYGASLMAEEILPDDLALRTGRRERALAQMEAERPRHPGAGPPGQRPVRHRGAAALGGGHPPVRTDLRAGPGHRRDPPEQQLGRGHPRGDRPRPPLRAGLESR